MQRRLNKLPYIFCYLVAFVLGVKQLREPDVWWQLLAGRWMLTNGQVTHSDVFSYTMAGHSWVNVKWLYEIFIALLEKAMGPEGVILLQALVNVVIVFVLIKCIKALAKDLQQNVSVLPAVLSILLFLFVGENRMAGRPEMFSHLFSAIFILFILRYGNTNVKKMWLLVPLQCLWANMHEGYPVGIVILGCYMVGSFLSAYVAREADTAHKARNAALIFAAAIAAILINPNGIQLWKQPFEIYRQVLVNKYTSELLSFSQPEYWNLQAITHIALLLGVVFFWMALLQQRRRQKITLVFSPASLAYLLLIPLFAYLSISANRNIIFAQIALVPSVALLFSALGSKMKSAASQHRSSSVQFAISLALAILFYIAVVSNWLYKRSDSPNRYGVHISMLHNPTGAADFLKQHNIKGTAFSDYFVSSYLLWARYPDFRSYIDLRDLDVFSPEFFNSYFELAGHPSRFYQLDSQYHFNYVVLSTSQMLPLQQQLFWKEGYYMVYADPVSVIFLKQNDANKALIADKSIVKDFSWPQPVEDPAWAAAITKLFDPATGYEDEDEEQLPIYAAQFYNAMQDYPEAIQLLLPQMSRFENDSRAYKTLAQSYMEYSKVTSDPTLKQARRDSAISLLDKAGAN